MPLTADQAEIRAILRTDRAWSAFALADLEPEYSAPAEWHIAVDGSALVLVYRAFEAPILFALGSAEDVAPLLDELAPERTLYAGVREPISRLLKSRGYRFARELEMWRMVLEVSGFTAPPHRATRLGPADFPELMELFEEGKAAGEGPPLFHAGMLRDSVFFGVREEGVLAAAAAAPLIAWQEKAAILGMVYTRRSLRGRGYGFDVSAAVAAVLARLGMEMVALNVVQTNAAAIRIYERLGFRRHCDYREGVAERA